MLQVNVSGGEDRGRLVLQGIQCVHIVQVPQVQQRRHVDIVQLSELVLHNLQISLARHLLGWCSLAELHNMSHLHA